VASLGLLVPLVMVLTPLWGMTGLAVAVLLTTLLWSVAMSWLVVRYLGIRPAIF
jgi:O-antigen/teichoic acid export membrane protein